MTEIDYLREVKRCAEALTVYAVEGAFEAWIEWDQRFTALRRALDAKVDPSPAPEKCGESGDVPAVSCRGCGDAPATRWVYSNHGVGYAMCDECDLNGTGRRVG